MSFPFSPSNIAYHGSERKLVVGKATRSSRVRNSAVITHTGVMAEVTTDTSPYKAHPIKTKPYNPRCGIVLPWAEVGIVDYDGLDYEREIHIPHESIRGKLMKTGDSLTVWLPEWFMSKVDD